MFPTRSTRKVAVASLALAGIVLAGCASASDEPTDASSSDVTESPTSGELRVGQTTGIAQLDPNTSTLSSERVTWNALWDGLVAQTAEGTLEPELALEWTASEDGLTWTFLLRDDVTFHDGRGLTAADVVDNILRVQDESNASRYLSNVAMVTSVEAASDYEVVFTLDTVTPQFAAGLVDIKMTDVQNIDSINSDANGTGPYVLESFIPDQEVVLTANPDYWGGAPATEVITITKYADVTSASSALQSGGLDLQWGVPYDQVADLQEAGFVAVLPEVPAQAAVWEIDNSSEPFDNPDARKALAYATDREAISAAAYGGLGEINDSGTIITPASDYFASDLSGTYAYDLDRAKELFDAAGVGPDDTFTCWAMAGGYPEFTTSCQVLQASMAEIGLTVEVETADSSSWAARFYPAGTPYPWTIAPDFLSREAPPLPFVLTYFGENGWSSANWDGTDEYEAAKQVVLDSAEEDEVRQAFLSAQEILSAEVPLVGILNTSQPSMAAATVNGVWVESNGTLHVESATVG